MNVRGEAGSAPVGTPLGPLALVHPFPSAVNALVVLAIALIAGGHPLDAATLALAMLALQFCIGSTNDVVDENLDARTKPWKPIPAGRVTRRAAIATALAMGAGSLVLAGLHGPDPLALAAGMLGAGLAYNFVLKRTAWSWVAYAVALPLLPLYAWWGAAGVLPPRIELLLPIAALAGPALQLTNALVDLERDRAGGVAGLANVLGRRRALVAAAAIVALIHGTAWAMLLRPGVPTAAVLTAVASTVLALAGLALSGSDSETRRERGWQAQTASIGLLAVAWLAAAALG